MQLSPKIEARPPQEFAFESAMAKLSSMIAVASTRPEVDMLIPGDEDMDPLRTVDDAFGFTERRGKLLRVSSFIDTESRTSIGCAGAILTYTGRRRAIYAMSSAAARSNAFQASNLAMFSLQNTM